MSDVWLNMIAAAAIRTTVVLGVAVLANRGLRKRSAATRHLLWSAALMAALVLPIASLLVPTLPMPVPEVVRDVVWPAAPLATRVTAPTTVEPRHRAPAVSTAARLRVESEHARGFGAVPMAAPPDGRRLRWPDGLLAIWLLGVAILGGRSLLGVGTNTWLAVRSPEIACPAWQQLVQDICRELGIRRPVRLLCSARASVPMTWGWRRPVVVVPADAEPWSHERRVVVLRHELAHVKRADYLTQLLGQVVTALYWYHPLVWHAARQLRVEREHACDDAVITLGTRASTYATHLLAIAQSVHTPTPGASTAIAMARHSHLEGRLMAILDPKLRRVATRTAAAGVVMLLAGLALVVSIVTPEAQTTVPTARQADGTSSLDEATVSTPVSSTQSVRVQGGQGTFEIEDLDLDIDAITRDAEAIAREVTARFENFEFTRHEDDDAPLDARLVAAFIDALSDSDAEVREEAASALGSHAVDEAGTPLVTALSDESPDVREEAAKALGRIRHEDAVPALTDALNDEHASVREEAAGALGDIGSPAGVTALVATLRDPDADVQEEAARALGQIGDPAALDGLIDALDGTTGDALEEVIEAVGEIGGERGLDALLGLMDSPEDEIRRTVISALSDGDWRSAGATPSPVPNPRPNPNP